MSESAPSVEIRSTVIDAILDHAREAHPIECCGLLVGSSGRIERAVRAHNTRASRTRYQIDSVDHIAAIRSARTAGLRVVGTYHSHPTGPPVPSPTDLAEATYADYAYLIVSPDAGAHQADRFGIYRLEAGRFEHLRLVVI